MTKQQEEQQQDELNYCKFLLFVLMIFSPCPHLSVGRSLRYRADGRNGRVGHSGGQRHGGQGGHARLALLPLVGHEGRQRVELFLTLPAQEDVLVVCDGERTLNKGLDDNRRYDGVLVDNVLQRQINQANFHPLPGGAPYRVTIAAEDG